MAYSIVTAVHKGSDIFSLSFFFLHGDFFLSNIVFRLSTKWNENGLKFNYVCVDTVESGIIGNPFIGRAYRFSLTFNFRNDILIESTEDKGFYRIER